MKKLIKAFLQNLPFNDGDSGYSKIREWLDNTHIALTLSIEAVASKKDVESSGIYSKKHEGNGWLITGEVFSDGRKYVNSFFGWHPQHGIVCGDFEKIVAATSKEAYEDFLSHFEIEEWNYWE